MPRYLHIPHTPDTARTLTLSGRNCLVVSGMVTTLKSATGAEKGAEAKCVHKARGSPTAGLLQFFGENVWGIRENVVTLHTKTREAAYGRALMRASWGLLNRSFAGVI